VPAPALLELIPTEPPSSEPQTESTVDFAALLGTFNAGVVRE